MIMRLIQQTYRKNSKTQKGPTQKQIKMEENGYIFFFQKYLMSFANDFFALSHILSVCIHFIHLFIYFCM